MNTEGPYRPLPKDDREYDPEKHVKVDEKSWVRKSVARTTEDAGVEAKRRSVVTEEPNWFLRLFGKTNKENFHTVLQEEALETDLGALNYEDNRRGDTESSWGDEEISGKYNGYDIKLKRSGGDLSLFEPVNGKIDGVELQKKYARKIWKKLRKLLDQRSKNREKLQQINAKLETKRSVLEVLGKLPPKETPELEQADEQKQLGPKQEE